MSKGLRPWLQLIEETSAHYAYNYYTFPAVVGSLPNPVHALISAESIVAPLNTEQRVAVTAGNGNYLVLAGAGCGKTRVLVHRIAWCVEHSGYADHRNILAVTFTNKAANEMRVRLAELLQRSVSDMWIGTFHGLANRLLRRYSHEMDLSADFQIMDADDQLRLIRRIMNDMQIDVKQWEPRQVRLYINNNKEEGRRANSVGPARGDHNEVLPSIYRAYESFCRQNQIFDFTELLLRCHEELLAKPSVLQHCRQRFSHLLVDEFQDINGLQYKWLRLLAGEQGRVFAVGDDDQSIYGWRGARPEYMACFEKDFDDAGLFRLEQNYRSAGNILAMANSLIQLNTGRFGKELWTEQGEGEKIKLHVAYNGENEARYVMDSIQQWQEQGGAYRDIALLYRISAQSRSLEEGLVRAGIPYRVYGGTRFYERQEIKDALAYLRLSVNPNDNMAFERVVNLPPRGIGERTMEQLRLAAKSGNMSLWQATQELMADDGSLTGRMVSGLRKFVSLISQFHQAPPELLLPKRVDALIKESGLLAHYRQHKEKRQAVIKVENLDELVSASAHFLDEWQERQPGDAEGGEQEVSITASFLAHAMLESGGGGENDEGGVSLMTLHSAKGLEFEKVFLVGLEEGLFPHHLSLSSPREIEEERRLCYVGITRARRSLTLTYVMNRKLHGRERPAYPSRFIKDLPRHLLALEGGMPFGDAGYAAEAGDNVLGRRVQHDSFGPGVIIDTEGRVPHQRVRINFESGDCKWLLADTSALRRIG